MGNDTTITPNGASYVYRLTLGNYISEEQSYKLTLKQGASFLFDDEEANVSYYVVFIGFKMIRKIYQPTEIVAELDNTQSITETSENK